MTYDSRSINAGPRFLSVGLIIKFLFFLSACSALDCKVVRLEEYVQMFLLINFCRVFFIAFSN